MLVFDDYQVHKIWKSHDKEWNISENDEKLAYLNIVNSLLQKQKNELNAFAIMGNHVHELLRVIEAISFSNLMRDHHSRYGMFFNKKHNRRGKVAYDRPKTCLIEDDEYSMMATFYVHANPVRAGITKNAANYKWSTHKLYAFGKREPFMKNVKFPQWYMDLGKTWEERQKNYRKLFDAYLREFGLIKQGIFENNFFGSMLWTMKNEKNIHDRNKDKDKDKDPPEKEG